MSTTPAIEVDLCGHATLASAYVIANRLEPGQERMTFMTRSGQLTVTRADDVYTMDFPARPPRRVAVSPAVAAALVDIQEDMELDRVFRVPAQDKGLGGQAQGAA